MQDAELACLVINELGNNSEPFNQSCWPAALAFSLMYTPNHCLEYITLDLKGDLFQPKAILETDINRT